jgi:CRISPR/Cas system-associated exonuclease Cas4 (RecB family)
MTATVHGRIDDRIGTLIEAITGDAFSEWYQDWQVKQHMRDGQPWQHTPASVTPPERHSPSQLLKCQRKAYYSAQNAPQEDEDPSGIFWAGTRIEEDIVMPFLETIADQVEEPAYVQNSMWIDYGLETKVGPLQVRGATDPVLCTRDGTPLLPTEIKTKESLEGFDRESPSPSRHHRAQLHAYLRGFQADEEVSHPVETGLIIYVSRKQHDLLPIRVEFDAEFFQETVVKWAAEQTTYRLEESLPPAEPEASWECGYCSYRERCGVGEVPYEDTPAQEFLPGVVYPQRQVDRAIRAEGGAAALTPTLAHEYPELAAEYDVLEWRCPVCSSTYAYETVEWNGRVEAPPPCPKCTEATRFVPLTSESPKLNATNE